MHRRLSVADLSRLAPRSGCRAPGVAVAALALTACAIPGGTDDGPTEARADQPLYGFGTLARRWPNGIVPVCWRSSTDHPNLQAMARSIATSTWSAAADIHFMGWADCGSSAVNEVTLQFSTQPDFRGNTSGLGFGRPVVTLISDDPRPGLPRFRYEVIHELGHALGFVHEMRRPDNWNGTVWRECGVPTDDPDYLQYSAQPGGITLTTTYDARSVMNYGVGRGPGCNPIAFPGTLSTGDIAGVQRPEAYGPPRPPAVTDLLVDAPFVVQKSPDLPRVLYMQALLPAGDGHSWSLASQDLVPDYAVSDSGGWKMAGDLNGDGVPDLINTVYLGPPGHGRPSGLRIDTALSSGPSSWALVSQDVAPDDPGNDVAGWKVAGDVNGDGRAELVHVVDLGQPGNGQPSGLRIDTALSSGPGTWTLVSQDVAPDHVGSSTAGWIAAGDVNADGRADLFETVALPLGADGRPTGLRIDTALSTGPGTWKLSSTEITTSFPPEDLRAWKVARLNSDQIPDFIHIGSAHSSNPNQVRVFRLVSTAPAAWALQISDLDPGAGGQNLSAWKIVDVNGDGLSDLVNPVFLGPAAGVRVRTALFASAFGLGYALTTQTLDTSNAIDDTASWQAMDVNGDHLADLVNVIDLGQNEPPQPSGLRVQTLLARGHGQWTLGSHDVERRYRVDDAERWRVAGPIAP